MGHKSDLQPLGLTRWELEGHRIHMRTTSSFLLPIWFPSHITQSSGLAPLCTESLDLSWVQCSHLALLVLRARCSSGVLLRPRVTHTLGTEAQTDGVVCSQGLQASNFVPSLFSVKSLVTLGLGFPASHSFSVFLSPRRKVWNRHLHSDFQVCNFLIFCLEVVELGAGERGGGGWG